MVSNSLGDGIVQMSHVASADDVTGVHGGALDINRKLDVVGAQVLILKIRKECGVLSWKRHSEWLKSFWSHDPG